eukprot:SAG22_NODE_1357_length_4629_cov_10.880922_1_plen_744_part_10
MFGTLADQLTYPMTADKTDIAQNGHARLKEILLEVDLDYLVDRPHALDSPQAWANILSLGEKQRMQIARLIYHRPKYAILDECSSAISTEMEQRLYRMVNDLKVTYVTIAHRPTLRAYHDRMLAIGDGSNGYTLTDIDRSLMTDKVLAMAKASVVSDEEEKSIRAHKAKRDAPFAALKEIKPLPERSTLRRSWRLWLLCKPNHATIKVLGLCVLIGLSTFIDHVSFSNTGDMFAVLMSGAKGRFNGLIGVSLLTSMAQGVLKESMLLIEREIGIAMAMKVERNLCKRLVRNNTFYQMCNIDRRIKDIAHRINPGVFMHVIGNILLHGCTPVVKVLFFAYKLWGLAGWQYPAALVLYYTLSLRVVRLAMPDYTWLHRKSSELDADFMMVHHRVKTAAEQIAFFDGGQREREIVEKSHAKLMDHQWKIIWMNFKLGIVQDIFQSRIPDVFQWVLRFGYGYLHGGTDAEVLADGGAMLNKNQTYLMAVLPQISGNLGAAIALSDRFAQIAGQIVRVAEFQEVLDELEEEQAADAARALKRQTGSGDRQTGDDAVVHSGIYTGTTEPKITLDDVTIVTPAGECIATGLTCSITPGRALMCTGRSASGKSSIVRAVAGLWPTTSGRLEVYNTTGEPMPSLKDLFVVPQQLLMASGTLADQLTYPDSIDAEDRTKEKEAELLKLLEVVGIDYLVERWGERDAGADDEYGLRRVGRQRGKEWDKVFAAGGLAHLRKAGVGRAAGQAQARAG